ncbi:hypothetical protein ACIF6L_35055 [Kitasatospora sp. NPDC086009]|uniref:hypothetical protein n=1 Tax=unclassified Kitasatospora TaxID=2633591 RepID=UPI0037CB7AC8
MTRRKPVLSVPDYAFSNDSGQLPDDLPFHTLETFTGPALGPGRPALLLYPAFHDEIVSGEFAGQSSVPYLLGGLEGFTQIADGTPARHTPAQLRGAARMGWKVRFAGGRLDIGRPGKAFRHTNVTGTPTWYGPTPAVLYVLISERPLEIDHENGKEIIDAAVSVTGVFSVLPYEVD